MARELTALPINHVRRQDRAVTDDDWIKCLLRRAPVGVLATVHRGQPFVNSNLFVYDEPANAIYFHTHRTGRTRANVEHDERVCFTVFEMGRFLPAPTALDFSVEYASAVVFGRAGVVDEEGAATHCLQMLLDKYAPHRRPGRDYRAPVPEELKLTSVYRVAIDSWSGKRKQVAPDFAGAFRYGEV
jgi:nitroimidazol reductase NimA-like FMN-containing flavoprotein (pyridoxamine 5'-phosphate oxidase superfamily)